jgi:hypothetical protein
LERSFLRDNRVRHLIPLWLIVSDAASRRNDRSP